MNVAIIGMGNLGTAVAVIAARNGHRVTGWEHNAAVVADIRQHRNERFLSGVVLPDSISATSDINAVFQTADIVFVTLPSRYFRSSLAEVASHVSKDIPLVNMAKGIDATTGKTAYQLLDELFPYNTKAMLAGPSLANEFVQGVLTAVVAATPHQSVFNTIAAVLDNERFAVAYSADVTGVEWGGILKNIYALGYGLLTGNGVFDQQNHSGLNFSGAYLTQALKEMKNYGVALGANESTFDGLSGVGDLIATTLSGDSHNATLGRYLASGLSLADAGEKMGSLPEGYNTLVMVVKMAAEKKITMPLASLILQAIHKEITVSELLAQLSFILCG